MNVCRDLQSLGVELYVVVAWAGNSQNPSDLAAWNPPAGPGLKPFKPVLPEISRQFAHFGLNSRIPWSTNTFGEAKRWTFGEWSLQYVLKDGRKHATDQHALANEEYCAWNPPFTISYFKSFRNIEWLEISGGFTENWLENKENLVDPWMRSLLTFHEISQSPIFGQLSSTHWNLLIGRGFLTHILWAKYGAYSQSPRNPMADMPTND